MFSQLSMRLLIQRCLFLLLPLWLLLQLLRELQREIKVQPLRVARCTAVAVIPHARLGGTAAGAVVDEHPGRLDLRALALLKERRGGERSHNRPDTLNVIRSLAHTHSLLFAPTYSPSHLEPPPTHPLIERRYADRPARHCCQRCLPTPPVALPALPRALGPRIPGPDARVVISGRNRRNKELAVPARPGGYGGPVGGIRAIRHRLCGAGGRGEDERC